MTVNAFKNRLDKFGSKDMGVYSWEAIVLNWSKPTITSIRMRKQFAVSSLPRICSSYCLGDEWMLLSTRCALSLVRLLQLLLLLLIVILQQWRQREFKVGGRSAERGRVWRGLGMGKCFLFRDLEMAHFGEFWGATFKVFLYRELLSGVRVDSVANFVLVLVFFVCFYSLCVFLVFSFHFSSRLLYGPSCLK